MQTKQDYWRFVAILRRQRETMSEEVFDEVLEALCVFLGEDNPRFDSDKFRVAVKEV